jgi:hypothetical protein
MLVRGVLDLECLLLLADIVFGGTKVQFLTLSGTFKQQLILRRPKAHPGGFCLPSKSA